MDLSTGTLLTGHQPSPAKVNIKDKELLRQLEDIDKFSDKDKGTILEILGTFIMKSKFQSLAVQKEL